MDETSYLLALRNRIDICNQISEKLHVFLVENNGNLRGIKEDKRKKASRSEEVRFFEYKG